MSLYSMTGFGQAERSTPSGSYRFEIRGVNNRYLDMQFRGPQSFANLEQQIKKTLGEKISRGSLTVTLAWDREEGGSSLTWDHDKVSAYLKIFTQIKSTFKLEGEVSLANLLTFSDFVKTGSKKFDEKLLWRHAKPILAEAIASFQVSRQKEGAYIERDLKKMLRKLSSTLEQIQKRAPERLTTYSAALAKRIEALAATAVEPQRLATEVALMADRLDISEECTRLAAHFNTFEAVFDSKEPVGKRMNFILQEMNREANTIASKANDTDIAHLSVTLKEIIEKMREQVQNIE